MNRRIAYYASRKNAFVWLAALLQVCSVVLRIAFFCGKGADAQTVWLQIVLPAAASLIFVLVILLEGEERLYRTAVPVFMLAVYFAAKVAMTELWLRYILLCWIAYLAFAVVYCAIVSGKSIMDWMITLMFALALSVLLYECRASLRMGDWSGVFPWSADICLMAAGMVLSFGMKRRTDGKYHPTWGDRTDGRRLRTLDPISMVANYIMPSRVGASNNVYDSIEITALERYMRQKRAEGLEGFGINEVFLAAYCRCVAKYPGINRFLAGQRVYSRDRDIQFCMVVKKEMNIQSDESIIKLHLDPADTAADCYHKFHDAVETIRNAPLDSNFDNTARYLTYIPGLVLKFVIWFFKTIDYFGLLPKFLLEVSPFHSSLFFTSMGSLGLPPIVHHLYNFGNMPVFVCIGSKRRQTELQPDGVVVTKRYLDYSFNLDERTVNGFYYAEVLRYFRRLVRHPELLDTPPDEVVRDIE